MITITIVFLCTETVDDRLSISFLTKRRCLSIWIRENSQDEQKPKVLSPKDFHGLNFDTKLVVYENLIWIVIFETQRLIKQCRNTLISWIFFFEIFFQSSHHEWIRERRRSTYFRDKWRFVWYSWFGCYRTSYEIYFVNSEYAVLFEDSFIDGQQCFVILVSEEWSQICLQKWYWFDWSHQA